MNGKPLPIDSDSMTAIVTYLHWISKNIPIYSAVPWLSLKRLSAETAGDKDKGKKAYEVYCALCHRADGQGGEHAPPVFGGRSFRKDAGLADISTLAAFIYWNMPYLTDTPVLTQEEAFDIAAYIASQPRPMH